MKLKELLKRIFRKRKTHPVQYPFASYHLDPSRLSISTRTDHLTYEHYFKYKTPIERQKFLIQSAAKEFMGKIFEMGLVKVVEYDSEEPGRDHLAVFYINILPPEE